MSEFAKILEAYGAWGLCAILLVGIVALFKKYDANRKEHLEDVKQSRNTVLAIKELVEAQIAIQRQVVDTVTYIRGRIENNWRGHDS